MVVVSFRLYCTEEDCDNETVVRRDRVDETDWKVNSLHDYDGLCPSCNPMVETDEDEDEDDPEEIALLELDNIGETAATNLRREGLDTVEAIQSTPDEDIIDVAWVGEKGLFALKERALDHEPQKRWEE